MKNKKKKVTEEQKENRTSPQEKADSQPEKEKPAAEPVKDDASPKAPSKKKARAIGIGFLLAVLVIAAGVYVGVSVYYRSHFLPNTVINGVDCSNADAAALVDRLRLQAEEYTLEITGRDKMGNPITIGVVTAADMDYALEDGAEKVVAEELQKQNEWLWFLRFLDGTVSSVDLNLPVTYDEEKLADAMGQMESLKKGNMTKAQDAYISEYSKAVKGYEIVPEVAGTQLDLDMVREAVVQAIAYDGSASVDLAAQGCYMEPEVTAEDPKLLENLEKANQWVGAKITYDWNGNEVLVDSEQIQEWITFSHGEPSLNKKAVAKFVAEQASQYDTYGKTRKFTTSLGVELSLPSGAYGWLTDRDAETEELISLIEKGGSVKREPVYASKGAVKGKNDIGSSYVEADLSNQHLYLYQNGNVVLETDFVSGNMSNGNTTPPGVFGITYKTTNAVLRGRDYETPVNYWMPFNGNVGMHDATWRAEFGGEIFLTNGSHGCINLPLDMAAAIYSYMSTGFPVICYYY